MPQFKLMLIGQQKSGKTAVINTVRNGSFHSDYRETGSLEYTCKVLDSACIADRIKIHVWRAAGSSEFKPEKAKSYPSDQGFGIVIDLADAIDKDSAEAYINSHLEKIKRHASKIVKIEVYLIGAKSDLLEPTQLAQATENLRDIAASQPGRFKQTFITSAKDNTSTQLGATHDEDITFTGVLDGVFQDIQDKFEARAKNESKAQTAALERIAMAGFKKQSVWQLNSPYKIGACELKTILDEANPSQPNVPEFFKQYGIYGSQSLFQLKKVYEDHVGHSTTIRADVALWCLTPARKARFETWLRGGQEPPCDAVQLAFKKVYKELKAEANIDSSNIKSL